MFMVHKVFLSVSLRKTGSCFVLLVIEPSSVYCPARYTEGMWLTVTLCVCACACVYMCVYVHAHVCMPPLHPKTVKSCFYHHMSPSLNELIIIWNRLRSSISSI